VNLFGQILQGFEILDVVCAKNTSWRMVVYKPTRARHVLQYDDIYYNVLKL